MFGRVAPRYDFLNHALCGGTRYLLALAAGRAVAAQRPARVLDLATGSGDVLLALARTRAVTETMIGADFCLPMLQRGAGQGAPQSARRPTGCGCRFPTRSFDAMTIAFGLRNFADRARRPARDAARAAPRRPRLCARVLASRRAGSRRSISVPALASCRATRSSSRRERGAYEYLGDSIRAFPRQPELAEMMREAGFSAARWTNLDLRHRRAARGRSLSRHGRAEHRPAGRPRRLARAEGSARPGRARPRQRTSSAKARVIRGRVQGAEKSYDAQITLGRAHLASWKCAAPAPNRGAAAAFARMRWRGSGWALLQRGAAGATSSLRHASMPAPIQLRDRTRDAGLIEEAPAGMPRLEFTLLLPLQLREALDERPGAHHLRGAPATARRSRGMRSRGTRRVASRRDEADDRALAALESTRGAPAGVKQVPRARIGKRAAGPGGHPRVWIGAQGTHGSSGARRNGRRSMPVARGWRARVAVSNGAAPRATGPLPGWSLRGHHADGNPSSASRLRRRALRVIPRAQIPAFLERELAIPGTNLRHRLAAALRFHRSGADRKSWRGSTARCAALTLELEAHYGERNVSASGGKPTSSANEAFPDSHDLSRFWRRDLSAEAGARSLCRRPGLRPVRGGGRAFSLDQEKQRRALPGQHAAALATGWTVDPGPRLEATLQEIDIARAEFRCAAARARIG